ISYLEDVGLGYLNLNRLSNSLSGGESQRINLATVLGSSLVGSMYILDEPSIGLHPRDTARLIKVLESLRNLGNTVIVVEHDEDIMQASDELIDIGPEAGSFGGELVFQGNLSEIKKENRSLTAKYLNGKESIALPSKRRKWKDYIQVSNANDNNLKNVSVKFPLQVMTMVTGVSGSGKSTLVKKVLYAELQNVLHSFGESVPGRIGGDIKRISQVEFVDQNPIGRSSRSNPVTFVKAYDDIRALYAAQKLSVLRGYKPSHFSFNVEGGRCEMCEGEGEVVIEMQFMADIHLPCETCGGKRFKNEVLEVCYNEKSIADVLNLTVDEAMEFFKDEKKITEKLKPLADVGLGYVQLGQSSSTLSGGEAQRIKLASFLQKGSGSNPTFFIFDEPTTGLHFHDIKKLLKSMEALLDKGHSLCIIEHNMEMVKCADWVIDLGPEGGEKGGHIVFEGSPEDLVKCKQSYTGHYLA
ncbi:MAG: excinuclease ABC subunit UvrA, partial [Bacteroidia bacterium]|nr:excinuclease ABC subunit UvrA [Bacteroidia bacterium]